LRVAPASSLTALAIALATPAVAQETSEDAPITTAQDGVAQAPAGEAISDDEIVVIAGSLRGQVDAPQPAIVELNEEDIASYGAGSLAELVAALSTETNSGRGRGGGQPVFLMNGLRVSSFREMRSFPPEAVQKVEILPEEVAQRYGFSPDQRVINFILKDNFSSKEIELEYAQPDRGGTSDKEVEATYLRIDGPSRLNVNLEYGDTSALTEAERGIIQTVPAAPGSPDPAQYRTLVGDSESYELTTNYTRGLGDAGASMTVNGTLSRNDSLSLSGLDGLYLGDSGEIRPLARDSRNDTIALGTTLNANAGDWQLTGTVDASHSRNRSRIDRPDLAGSDFDTAISKSDSATAKMTAIGRPVQLPAGELAVTLDAGYDWDRIRSEDTRAPGIETELIRGDLNGGVNISVPIASRSDDVMAVLGNLNANLSAGVNHLSDFGTLTDWSAGLNWSPVEKLNLQATYIVREAAPGLNQLGAPTIVNFNVPVFDFATGQTVLAEITSGGNPNLQRETQRDIKLGTFYELPLFERSSLSVEYFRNRSEDVTAGFPLLTPDIEAAFPDRVTRVGGMLVAIDQRAVTFAEQRSSRIRTGINLSGRIGSAPEGEQGGRGRGGGGFAGPSGGGPGGPAGPGAGQGGGGPMIFFGGPGGSGGQGGGGFNRERFQQFRQELCAEGGGEPDLTGLPEQMQQRFKREDGTIDPERLAEARQQMCGANGGPGGGMFNPEGFQRLQQAFCVDRAPRPDPDLSILPEQFRQRLMGPDGVTPDPERLKQLQDRVCAADPAQFAAGQGGPQGQPGQPANAQPAQGGGQGARGGRGGGGGGGGFFPGGGGGGNFGRWNLSFNHTYEIENEVLIAPGGPLLDLLDGDALTGGGVSRHSFEAQGGAFYNGMGLRFRGTYNGKSRIDGSGLPGSTDLYFDDIFKLDLRLFADLGRKEKLVAAAPFLKGTRISLAVDNVFDARQRITDSAGAVPLRYQPFLIDPIGRKFEIEFRKLF
jgi:iron complex outermembrane receptor protein